MISDLTGRRPLPVRDYVVSIEVVVLSCEITCESLATPCVTELDR